MRKTLLKDKSFPVLLEKDEDGVYIAECPVFSGCYSQGRSIDQALKKIRDVISLCLEEKDNLERAKNYSPADIRLYTVRI
ncbi:MAG: type II toxin-antitoxin system HicB family antitoxin [Patescibacteria group bacterium]|nr:type II toxin-antitoxin system HicB family antitoxin [Patescibacteria group bacterium]MDE1966879.1 type II toxin-antitoxin system HicB family antitoxin [Patescibacteria group bacterium]